MTKDPDMEFVERLKTQLTAMTEELKREKELHIWEYTPAMAQAKIDQLNVQLAAMTAERDERKEMTDWFLALVPRANIGTEKTPSLRAYVVQLEREVDRLRSLNRLLRDRPDLPLTRLNEYIAVERELASAQQEIERLRKVMTEVERLTGSLALAEALAGTKEGA